MADNKDTLNLVVIGPKHTGKTVYFTALANCPGVSLSDPATIELVTLHWKGLQDGKTPPATAGSISNLAFTFQCDTGGQSYNVDFTMPDYDGHFAETLSKFEGNNDIVKLRAAISEADGFIVFMPVDDDDKATMEELRHEIGSFIDILRKVYDEYAKVPAPLIIAVNKWDKSPFFKNPDEDKAALDYVRSVEIYNLIYERLKSYFANVTVLPISSYGHKTKDANPIPGEFAPYRVTEPVALVVDAFFDNLRSMVEKDAEARDYAGVASTLLETQPLWQRWPGGNFSELLKNSLRKCYEELAAALKTAQKSSEYDSIWKKSPQSVLVGHFTPAEQVELAHLKKPLLEAEKRRNMKIGAIAAGLMLLVGVVWYGIDFNNKFDDAWLKAANAEPQTQIADLNGFLREYEGSALAGLFGSGKLEIARQKLNALLEDTRQNLDQRLAEIVKIADSCKRQDEAEQLMALAERVPDSIPVQSMGRLESILKSSREICAVKSRIETASGIEELEEAKKILSAQPGDGEIDALRNAVAAKSQHFWAEARAAQERERIAPIREEFNGILREQDLNKALSFIREHERDENPEVLEMTRNASAALPEILYIEIRNKIEKLTDLAGDDFGEMHSFVKDHQSHIELTPGQRASIAAAMQEKVEKLDKAQINTIPDIVSTQQEYQNLTDSLAKTLKADAFNLDGGLFEYTRPQALAAKLNNKIEKYRMYKENLDHGLNAQWAILAADKNAINLDCENLIPIDARLSITFSGYSLPDKSYNDTLSCRRLDGGNGYAFFYSGRVRPYNGGVRLTKVRRWPLDPLNCTSHLNISADDIIKLSNGQPLLYNLANNCPGISFRFSR